MDRLDHMIVAPFAGAWIEIKRDPRFNGKLGVAPFAGAWIEIAYDVFVENFKAVAPFAGAWIEIIKGSKFVIFRLSRSLRGSVD